MRIIQSGIKVFIIPPTFNRMSFMDRLTGMTRLDSYFVHYAGYDIQFGEGSLLKALDRDIERWKQDAPFYTYRRKIFIWAFGGIGDVICAEPVLRFIKEKAYTDADIYVLTKNPEIFRHIEGISIGDKYPEGEFDAVYEMNTHFIAHEKFHSIVPHPLAHCIDWIAMAILGRQLTNDQKQIRLSYNQEDLDKPRSIYKDLENLVLIHAGKGWGTKTFPKEWWNKVIEGIRELGLEVGLIGKNVSEDHGYVDTDCEVDADFRDKLSLKELIALISKAPLLITNDSAPIHIAGAFDNKIILLPTCKHPDYLLPFRKGTQSYKTKALFRKILDDDDLITPTSLKGWKMAAWQVSQFQEGKTILDYIPAPEEVVSQTLNFLFE
jgi:ADP-heptose:LPS heptosyltransferase